MTSVPDPRKVRRIAVRLTNWVGDSVMNTPFLAALGELFPSARIVLMGRGHVVTLFRHHPGVFDVWPIDDRSAKGWTAAARRLRAFRADLGFALPNSMNSALLLAAGGARHRVGYARDARRLLLTHPIALRPRDLAVHEVRYYMRLLSPWKWQGEVPALRLHVTGQECDAMRAWLSEQGIAETQPIVGINPAAFYGTAKRWLPERFAEVGRHFVRKHGAAVFVTGIESERPLAEEVCRVGGEGFHNAAGRMDLRELMAFLTHCRLFLTNDSGAMHVAAALKTPLLAIFGSTDWVTTAPLSPVARIVRRETECAPCLLRDCPIDHRCMMRIESAEAIEAAEALWVETEGWIRGAPRIIDAVEKGKARGGP